MPQSEVITPKGIAGAPTFNRAVDETMLPSLSPTHYRSRRITESSVLRGGVVLNYSDANKPAMAERLIELRKVDCGSTRNWSGPETIYVAAADP